MRLYGWLTVAVLAGSSLTVSGFGAPGLQRKGGGGGGGGSAPSHTQKAPPSRAPNTPPAHAQREPVRTPNYVPRSTGGGAPKQNPPTRTSGAGQTNPTNPRQPYTRQSNNPPPNRTTARKPIVPGSPGVQAQRKFTKTAAGRKYDNGVILRKGVKVTTAWQKKYFPKGHFHFPFYRTSYVRGQTFISPFGFFFGVCVPFIAAADCHIFPPSVVFIDVPVYVGVNCTGFGDADRDNLFGDPGLEQEEPGLLNAVDDLTEAFQGGNIDGLVSLVDPNTSVAVYLRGHYQYSLSASDYIDLARDAIQSMHTVQFSLTDIHERAPGVFSVGGQQTYADQSGAIQTTWVSFVLQDIGGQWTLTQVGTAPGVYRRPVM